MSKPIRRRVPEDPADRMRAAGKVPATPEMFRIRCELFRDMICKGISRQLIGRAIEARTTPGPEDGPDVVRSKRELALSIGAPLTLRQVEATYDRVAKQILEDFEKDAPFARAVQATRLQQDLLAIRQDIDRSKGPRDRLFLAAHRHEELFSKVVGTQAPREIKLDATVEARRSLIAVVMNLTPEEEEQAIREQEEHERLEAGDVSSHR